MRCTSDGCDRSAFFELLRVTDRVLRLKCGLCAEELVAFWPEQWRYVRSRFAPRPPTPSPVTPQ